MAAVAGSTARVAGIALVIAPLAALLLRSDAPHILLESVTATMLLPGPLTPTLLYILAIVIALIALLPTTATAVRSSNGTRVVIAAWCTAVAALAAAWFGVDRRDDDLRGSPFLHTLYDEITHAEEQLSSTLFVIAAVICGSAMSWLVVEWLLAGHEAGRARRGVVTASVATARR